MGWRDSSGKRLWCLGSRGEVPEWPKGADCKSAGYAFEGSNPSLSTILLAGIAQLVEREPSKLGVAGSSPVSRSNLPMAMMAEGRLCSRPLTGMPR
jgi:hypothetical protein